VLLYHSRQNFMALMAAAADDGGRVDFSCLLLRCGAIESCGVVGFGVGFIKLYIRTQRNGCWSVQVLSVLLCSGFALHSLSLCYFEIILCSILFE
jgi:hypothetical protein